MPLDTAKIAELKYVCKMLEAKHDIVTSWRERIDTKSLYNFFFLFAASIKLFSE